MFSSSSKGQKFRRFSDEERTEIVNKYLSGKYSYQILINEYGISGVQFILWLLNTIKLTTISEQKGRPKEKDLTHEDYKKRYEILKKYRVFLKVQQKKK